MFAVYSRANYLLCALKKTRVMVHLKSPDKVRITVRSYRGFSFLPVIGIVLERKVVHRLQELCRMEQVRLGIVGNLCDDGVTNVTNNFTHTASHA